MVIVNSQSLTCHVPAGSLGIPTVSLTSTAGTFTSLNTAPSIFGGYVNHPNLTGVSLSTLQTKWSNSTYADYVTPLKRNVSAAAFLSGVSGTFSVGDTVTQGGTTGICYGLHYGFAVLFATSGTYVPGAIADTTSGAAATIVVIGTIPGMQSSFTAPVTSVTGTFNPGDIVTQGNTTQGLVYSYAAGVIGIMPMVSSFASVSQFAAQNPFIIGPSGNGTLSLNHTQNSPYDGSGGAWGGWGIYSWQDFAWYDLFSNTSTYDTPLWNGSTLLGGSNGLTAALNRVTWVDQQQYFSLEGESVPIANFYDWAWPSLSQAQKTQILNYLDKVHSLCTTLIAQNSVFFQTGIVINNWATVGSGACVQIYLAEQNSVYSVLHGASPDVKTPITNIRSTDPTYAVNSYATTTIDPSGVALEGSQYTQYGMVNYTATGIACQSATGSGSCNVTGKGLVTTNGGSPVMPNYLLQAIQPDLTWSGDPNSQWFSYNDTEPQSYGVAYLADQCDRLSSPTLCFIADTMQHQIATTDAFAGHLNWQASRGADYGYRAFLYRSATTGTFGGWSTARYDPSNSYAVLRSATTLNPALVCGIKGTNAAQIIEGHRHGDAGSFVCQTQGEGKFLDPGYFLTSAGQHSTVSVDGTVISPLSGTTSFDTVNFIDSPNFWSAGVGKESIAVDVSGPLGTSVSQARRTISTYGAKAILVLDDVITTGAGNVSEVFQAQGSVAQSGTNNVTNTITGANSALACTFYGPTTPGGGGNSWTTSLVAGNLPCCRSSVMGVRQPWHDLEYDSRELQRARRDQRHAAVNGVYRFGWRCGIDGYERDERCEHFDHGALLGRQQLRFTCVRAESGYCNDSKHLFGGMGSGGAFSSAGDRPTVASGRSDQHDERDTARLQGTWNLSAGPVPGDAGIDREDVRGDREGHAGHYGFDQGSILEFRAGVPAHDASGRVRKLAGVERHRGRA